jgi:hypothetical protein
MAPKPCERKRAIALKILIYAFAIIAAFAWGYVYDATIP